MQNHSTTNLTIDTPIPNLPDVSTLAIYSPGNTGYWDKRGGVYSFEFTTDILAARTFKTEYHAVKYLKHVRTFVPDVILVQVVVATTIIAK